MLIHCHFSPRAESVSGETHLQAVSAISEVQGTLWHHCDRKSFSISPSTGTLPSSWNGCKQIAAKQNSGHWAFSQFVLLVLYVLTSSVTTGHFGNESCFPHPQNWDCVLQPAHLGYYQFRCESRHCAFNWDTRIKICFVRENSWLNFQILKISRTHWKSRKKLFLFYWLWQHILTAVH